MMLIAGVAEVINAFQIKTSGKFIVWLLLGALYIAVGFFTFESPLVAGAILTLFLGISLIAFGVMRIDAFGLGATIRGDHAFARLYHCGALVCLRCHRRSGGIGIGYGVRRHA